MFRIVFWDDDDDDDHSSLMMEAVRTSETSVDNHFTRQYIPEDNSEHHTRRRENLKSHTLGFLHFLSQQPVQANAVALLLAGNEGRH
jgi:hypothetical protein